ncbi:MAG: hypothetical protein ACTS2F_07265 [Thainema sp.]
MDNQDAQNLPFWEAWIPYIMAGIILFFIFTLAWGQAFGYGHTELTCTRSSTGSLECNLIRGTMSPIQIVDPIAVDVIKRDPRKKFTSYSAEIRAEHVSYTLTIMSSFNSDITYDVANKINDFLLRSDESEFYMRYPEDGG